MKFSEGKIREIESRLDSFNRNTRHESLAELVELAQSGKVNIQPETETANLHCHSFFSYNGYGYSPTRLAWLARKHGIKFMGVVDFDVLDAVDEFLDACEIAGVHGTAGIETRTHIPEFEHAEINSPGEPGILYHMGTGFTTSNVQDSAAVILKDISTRAGNRNRAMLSRINSHLAPLHIDYEKDVLRLTPAGNVTERHMVQVIAEKASEMTDDPIAYWTEKLAMPGDQINGIAHDPNKFKDLLRAKLMKRGSVGYTQPTAESFPSVDEFHAIMQACGALPCAAWLDGTSKGEQAIEDLLNLLITKGVTAINIIPDRSWNIKDKDDKARKLKELYRIVDLAETLDLPILVGTEMNKFGQRIVDDFSAPELEPVVEQFIKGAYFLYGHTQLQRYWGLGFQSEWANGQFTDRKAKNAFYEQAGRMIMPGGKTPSSDLVECKPDEVLDYFIHQ